MAATSKHDIIDSSASLNLDTIALSDIRWQYGTFRPFSKGSGRDKTYWSRSGVQTPIGDIREDVWCEVAEYIVQRDNEQRLLDALVEWAKEHCAWIHKPGEFRKEALELYSNRIFDDPQWVDYLLFNRAHRPEVLEHAHIVTVVHDCCKIPGGVTQEQIDRAYNGQISCPHCGRWNKFTIQGDTTFPPWEVF